MRINLRRLLFQVLGLDLIAQELTKLVMKKLDRVKIEVQQKIFSWIFLVFVFMGLIQAVFLFSLGALALYLNTLWGSSYQGFLWVAGGCTALLLMLLLRQVYWLFK